MADTPSPGPHDPTGRSPDDRLDSWKEIAAYMKRDVTLVTFGARNADLSDEPAISVWAVPVLGGRPRPYPEGAAELDWSADGARLVYHTPRPRRSH